MVNINKHNCSALAASTLQWNGYLLDSVCPSFAEKSSRPFDTGGRNM